MPFISDQEIDNRLNSPSNLANRDLPKLEDSAIEAEVLERRDITDIEERKDARSEQIEETKIVPLHNGGRRPGDKNLPEFMRSIIGVAAREDTLANTAEAFGVSVHHAHELKHGKHSNAQGQNDELVDAINDRLDTPNKLAVDRLTKVLMKLDDNKIDKLKSVKGIVNAAQGLAKIAQATTPIKKDTDEDKSIRLVVFAPTLKSETHYETVEVAHN